MQKKTTQNNKNRKKYIPSAFTILFAMMIIFIVASWIGNPLNNEINKVGLLDIFTAAWHGFASKAEVILFIFAIGGALGVMTKLKAIDGGIQALINRLKGKEWVLIVVLMIVFGLGGTTYGMWEETIAFFPVLIPIFVGAGYGPFVAVMVVLIGAGTGCLASTINPFAVSVAIDAINGVTDNGVNVFENFTQGVGQGSRWLSFFIFQTIGIMLVLFFARLYRKRMGIVKGINNKLIEEKFKLGQKVDFTLKRKIILSLFILAFVIMVVMFLPWGSFLNLEGGGTISWWDRYLFWIASTGDNAWEPLGSWYFVSVAAIFLLITVIIFAIGHKDFVSLDQTKEETFISQYMNGVKDMVNVSLLIGVAAGLGIILKLTNFGPLIARSISGVAGSNLILWGLCVFFISLVLSFLVPSTSGFASAFIGIFATAIHLGTNESSQFGALSLTILAFIFASGVINLCAPTSAALMGYTAYSGVPYPIWIKNVYPIVLTYLGVSILLIIMFGIMANSGVLF